MLFVAGVFPAAQQPCLILRRTLHCRVRSISDTMGRNLLSFIFRWLCDPSERSAAAPCCLAITPGATRAQPQAVVKCADMLSWCYANDKFERPRCSYSAKISRHDQAEALGLLTWPIRVGSHVLYVSYHRCRHYIENSCLQDSSAQIVKADIYYRIGKRSIQDGTVSLMTSVEIVQENHSFHFHLFHLSGKRVSAGM